MKLWKVLRDDGSPFHGGNGRWSLPTDDCPGEWMPPIEIIAPCVSGYHLCRDLDLIEWLGPAIYEAEAAGKIIKSRNKVVCQSARIIRRLNTWNAKTARIFACDCAWAVLPLLMSKRKSDLRPKRSVLASYLYAHGMNTEIELATARNDAWEAISDATGDAAKDAAEAAWAASKIASWDAAKDAAEAAAEATAWAACAATRDSTWTTARAWQTRRLFSHIYPRH